MKGALSLVELLHQATGGKRSELRPIVAAMGNPATISKCALHKFKEVKTPLGSLWKCVNCGRMLTRAQLDAYEQGLAHGRANASGGGRF